MPIGKKTKTKNTIVDHVGSPDGCRTFRSKKNRNGTILTFCVDGGKSRLIHIKRPRKGGRT